MPQEDTAHATGRHSSYHRKKTIHITGRHHISQEDIAVMTGKHNTSQEDVLPHSWSPILLGISTELIFYWQSLCSYLFVTGEISKYLFHGIICPPIRVLPTFFLSYICMDMSLHTYAWAGITVWQFPLNWRVKKNEQPHFRCAKCTCSISLDMAHGSRYIEHVGKGWSWPLVAPRHCIRKNPAPATR